MLTLTRARPRIEQEGVMVGRITAAIVLVGVTAALLIVFTTGAIAAPMSTFWIRALDPRPEASATGAALLVLASVRRRSLPKRPAR